MSVTDEILADAGATEALVKAYLGGDNHTNPEPVHDDATDLDANDFNRLVKAVAECVKRLRPGNVIRVPFEMAAPAANTANQSIAQMGSTTTYDRLFKNARLIGISAQFGSLLTGGTATVQCQIAGGTNSALSVVITSGHGSGRAEQLPSEANSDEYFDASNIEITYFKALLTTASCTWAGSSKLQVGLFFSIGEEEDI